MLRDNGQPCIISDNGHGHPCIIMSGQWTDLVMAVRIIDKDITQVVYITQIVQVPRLSSRVLFLTREGMDGGMWGMIQRIVMIWHGSLSRCFIYLYL